MFYPLPPSGSSELGCRILDSFQRMWFPAYRVVLYNFVRATPLVTLRDASLVVRSISHTSSGWRHLRFGDNQLENRRRSVHEVIHTRIMTALGDFPQSVEKGGQS